MQHDTDRHTPERAAEIALEAEPPAIYARPAEIVEFVPSVIADTPGETYACPCELHDALATDPNVATFAASAGPVALVGAMSAPLLTRAAPYDTVRADAWRCQRGHCTYVLTGHQPLTCIACEAGGDFEAANQSFQRDICGEFLMARYHDDPASFLAKFDGFHHRIQHAITRAVAAFLDEPIETVDTLWLESRVRLAGLD